MFHSNELSAGTSPYFNTDEEEIDFQNKIIEYVKWLESNFNLEWNTLSDFANPIEK